MNRRGRQWRHHQGCPWQKAVGGSPRLGACGKGRRPSTSAASAAAPPGQPPPGVPPISFVRPKPVAEPPQPIAPPVETMGPVSYWPAVGAMSSRPIAEALKLEGVARDAQLEAAADKLGESVHYTASSVPAEMIQQASIVHARDEAVGLIPSS